MAAALSVYAFTMEGIGFSGPMGVKPEILSARALPENNFAVSLQLLINMHMTNMEDSGVIQQAIDELSCPDSLKGLCHEHCDGNPLPSQEALQEIIDCARSILFPGYYGNSAINTQTISYHIGVSVERLHHLLSRQILAGLCFQEREEGEMLQSSTSKAADIATEIVATLPTLRKLLATDVEAAYDGDPAATSYSEIIACYPALKALTCYRLAHELVRHGVPLIPRVITEMAHSETGIDIHPAAEIGHHFTIDHGTGVVVGATCIIGNHVKLYQGVTLGARSFPLDDNGNPIKGIPRHPILEDNVVVYSNATILGRVTIGHDSVIGANMWITEDVGPRSRVMKG